MYNLIIRRLEQLNLKSSFAGNPGMDTGIHWLNPLLFEYGKDSLS
ncbi:MAG: hypothetical protein N2645_14805 [Clostridia bacterium]|nr:hypothetical protein [Clostridia bacterium]